MDVLRGGSHLGRNMGCPIFRRSDIFPLEKQCPQPWAPWAWGGVLGPAPHVTLEFGVRRGGLWSFSGDLHPPQVWARPSRAQPLAPDPFAKGQEGPPFLNFVLFAFQALQVKRAQLPLLTTDRPAGSCFSGAL